ncbi:putative DNA binding domain-containing protein, partial [Paracoccaceae bacterium]|nr:putative DNA binding domain-containing protein [Paracoccaceae bacterium]
FAMAELIEKILTVEKNERHDNPEITSENMLKFYHKAAEAGITSAQISLGNLYNEGHLVERNTDLADYWYQLATAKKDNSKALEAYTNFLIEEDQFDKAKEYAELGTKIDETKFMHLLLKISMVKKDSKNAIYWAELLEKENDAKAMLALFAIYAGGFGTSEDKAKAMLYLRKAADFGSSDAQYALGEFYVDWHYEFIYAGTVEEYPSDDWHTNAYELGVFWLKTAAEQGNGHAQYKLSTFLTGEGEKHWFDMAVAQGHPEALAELEENIEQEITGSEGDRGDDEYIEVEPSKAEKLEKIIEGPTAQVLDFPKTFKGSPKDDSNEELMNTVIALQEKVRQLESSFAYNSSKPKTTRELIRGDEKLRVEFKETFSLDTRTGAKKSVEIRHAALKAICGFLNTCDGTLLIGVRDGGKVTGIECDGFDGNQDKYTRLIIDLIKVSMGTVAAGNVEIKFEELEGKVVCIVECKKGASPTFLTFKNYEEDFLVRIDRASVSPPPSEILRIVNERF